MDPTPDRQPLASFRHAALTGSALGAAAGLLTASIDLSSALLGSYAGSRDALALYILSLTVVAASALGVLLALFWTAIERLAQRPSRAAKALAMLLDALPLAAFLLYAPMSWIAEAGLDAAKTWIARGVLLLLCVVAVVVTKLGRWLIGWFERSLRGSRPLATGGAGALAWLAGAGCYLADAKLFPDDYNEFHDTLAAGVVAMMAIAAALLRAALRPTAPRAMQRTERGLQLTAVALFALLVGLDAVSLDAFRKSQALVFGKLMVQARGVSDFDGDGFSAVLGGRDCAPFDALRSPKAIEVPENGVDEDCTGADERWPLAPPAPVPRGTAGKKLNVLFITIDTLRADHLGTYGYARKTSPNIDRLASESIVFERAFAQATKTWDSVPSFLTGMYPSNVPRKYDEVPIEGRRPALSFVMHKDQGLLAEAFAKQGYNTKALVSSWFMDDVRLNRGFDHFRNMSDPVRNPRKLVESTKEPFFIWLHYAGPHEPYKRHAKYDFGDRPIDRYDGEIAREDENIARVLEGLDARDIRDSTIVIINADHGEEFGEHGGKFHLQKHYRELLHVPLIVRVPGIAPTRIADAVELVDIAPTLYELCNVPAPRARLDGQSLLATLSAPRPFELAGALAEVIDYPGTVRQNAFFDGRYRLVDIRPREQYELYDTKNDLLEQKDVSSMRPDALKELRERLAVRALRSRSPRIAGTSAAKR